MEITPNEIHLWCAFDEEIDVNFALSNYTPFLSSDEKTQYKKFYFDKDKHQYLVTRTLVRSVLSKYINGIAPSELNFVTNDYKKPYISPQQAQIPIQFNISHSDKMVVLAVTVEHEVGVDVEYLKRDNSGLDIAERFFAEHEYQELNTLPEKLKKQRFFSLWTMKEAYIKACGKGLYIPLDEFWFSFPELGTIDIVFAPSRNDNPENWQFWQFKPSEQHLISLAVQGSSSHSRNVSIFKTIPLVGTEGVQYPLTVSKS